MGIIPERNTAMSQKQGQFDSIQRKRDDRKKAIRHKGMAQKFSLEEMADEVEGLPLRIKSREKQVI